MVLPSLLRSVLVELGVLVQSRYYVRCTQEFWFQDLFSSRAPRSPMAPLTLNLASFTGTFTGMFTNITSTFANILGQSCM